MRVVVVALLAVERGDREVEAVRDQVEERLVPEHQLVLLAGEVAET